MKLTDILELTKQGYSVTDMKEINELSKENEEVLTLAKQTTTMSDLKDLLSLQSDDAPGGTDESDQTPPDDTPEGNEDSEDIEKLKAQLREAQEKNRAKDHSGEGERNDEEILKDLMRSCY